jgi:hypothetical protein
MPSTQSHSGEICDDTDSVAKLLAKIQPYALIVPQDGIIFGKCKPFYLREIKRKGLACRNGFSGVVEATDTSSPEAEKSRETRAGR